jgi:hypothetical protein
MKEVRIVRVYFLDLKTFRDHLKATGLWDKGVYTVADLWYYVDENLSELDTHLKPFCAAYYNRDTGEKKEHGTIFCGGDNGYEFAAFVRVEGDEPTTYCHEVTIDGDKSSGCTSKAREPGYVTFIEDTMRKLGVQHAGKTLTATAKITSPNTDQVSLSVNVKMPTVITDYDLKIVRAERHSNDVLIEFEVKNNTSTDGIIILKVDLDGYVPWNESYPLRAYETKRIKRTIPFDPREYVPTYICLTPLRADLTEIKDKKVCYQFTATVTIATTPPGAKVYIDGEYKGTT